MTEVNTFAKSRGTAVDVTSHAIVALCITLFALGVRLYAIDMQSYWFDEGASLSFARVPWGELWGAVATQEPNPPAYYSLLKLWTAVFGTSESAVRLLSAIASALCVVPLYFVALRAFGRSTAVIAALMLAVSGIQVHYGQEARCFAILSLVFLTAILLGGRIADRHDPRSVTGRASLGEIVLFGACCAVLPHLHQTGFLAVAVVFVYVAALIGLRGGLSRPAIHDLAAAGILTVVISLPVLYWMAQQMRTGAELVAWIPEPTLWKAKVLYRSVFGHGYLENAGHVTGGQLWHWISGPRTLADGLLAAVVAFGVAQAARNRAWEVLAAATAVAFLVVTFFAVSQIQPILLPRTVLFGSPLVLLITAYALTSLSGHWYGKAAVVAVLAFQIANLTQYFRTVEKEPWRQVIAAARGLHDPTTAVVYLGPGTGISLPAITERYWVGPLPTTIFVIDPQLPKMPQILGQFPHFQAVEVDDLCGALAGFDGILVLNRGRRSTAPGVNAETEEFGALLRVNGATMQEAALFDPIILQAWSGLSCWGRERR